MRTERSGSRPRTGCLDSAPRCRHRRETGPVRPSNYMSVAICRLRRTAGRQYQQQTDRPAACPAITQITSQQRHSRTAPCGGHPLSQAIPLSRSERCHLRRSRFARCRSFPRPSYRLHLCASSTQKLVCAFSTHRFACPERRRLTSLMKNVRHAMSPATSDPTTSIAEAATVTAIKK